MTARLRGHRAHRDRPLVTLASIMIITGVVQAAIRSTRYPTDERITWVPAGRHNRTAVLPKV